MTNDTHITRPGRSIPATGVEQVANPTDLPHLFGRHLVQVHAGLCHPIIEPGNVLDVDFDVRSIRGDGLYLLQATDSQWFGARLFQVVPYALRIKHGDEWHEATPDIMARYNVCGYVHEVYKPRGH